MRFLCIKIETLINVLLNVIHRTVLATIKIIVLNSMRYYVFVMSISQCGINVGGRVQLYVGTTVIG